MAEISRISANPLLLFESSDQTWLNVAGTWNEYLNGHIESIYISSSLVPVWASASLQRAAIYQQTECMTLTHFERLDHDSCASHHFKLKRWYAEGDRQERVDEFDPYAGALDYPPITINQEIALELELTSESERRFWFHADTGEVLFCSQLWSEDKPRREDNDYCSKGSRLQASLKVLKTLLNKLNMDLAIQVDIRRHLTNRYRDEENDVGYTVPYRKIYVLSKDGRLRDTRASFELREKVAEKL